MRGISRGGIVARYAATLTAGALALTACGIGGGSDGADSKDFTLAVVNSLSGGYEFLGKASNAGIEAAVSELNEQGGIDGRQITIESCDDHVAIAHAFRRQPGQLFQRRGRCGLALGNGVQQLENAFRCHVQAGCNAVSA